MKPKPNVEQNESYLLAFDHFNTALFNGELPRPMLTLTRTNKISAGYTAVHAWVDEEGNGINEIQLNANHMRGSERSVIDMMGTLIHEMAHHWQIVFGTPTRSGYHNREWTEKAKSLGLTPKDVKTGKETGQSIDTSLVDHGPAENAIRNMPEDAYFPWEAIPGNFDRQSQPGRPRRSANRSKYTCPNCKTKAWAKPGITIICGECRNPESHTGHYEMLDL